MPFPANPDTRPLPPGWYQHYDPSRGTWYYIQTSVHPPKHSYLHPAELLNKPSSTVTRQNSASIAIAPCIPQAPRLSAAQRLYASANVDAGGPTLTIPRAEGARSDSPPTSSASNPSSLNPHAPESTPCARPSPIPQQNVRPSGMRAQSQGPIFTTATNPANFYNSQRSSTYPSAYPSQSKISSISSAPWGVNQVRHVVTKAQPPSHLLSGGAGSALPTPAQAPANPAQGISQHKAAHPLAPPPSHSFPGTGLNSTPASHPSYAPPNVPKQMQAPSPQTSYPSSPNSPTEHAKRAGLALKNVGKQVGKQIGLGAAKFVASGVSTALTGIDMMTLANAFTGTSFDVSSLQAVLEAQPNADYWAAIAALQQQQQQQVSPAVDYTALISHIQQLQAMAIQQQPQQQQIMSMQLTNFSSTMAAQQAALGGLDAGLSPSLNFGALNAPASSVPTMTPSPMAYGYSLPQQQSPSPPAPYQGQGQNPTFSTNPFDTSPMTNNFAPPSHNTAQHPNTQQNQLPPNQPPIYQSQSPPVQQQSSPPTPHNPSSPAATTTQAPPQDDLFQTLQAQQAIASQQLQAQIQQYQLAASQGQSQQAMMAQIMQQQGAIRTQQQAAISQAVQQQQQAQHQQNQALLNAIIAPPPPAPAPTQEPSLTDLMAGYLNGALNGGQSDSSAATEIPPSYSGLMSSLGLGSTATGDLSSLSLSADLTLGVEAVDLSSLMASAA